mmetsp:Transcript_38046/g.123077  ORF Transcript_38046/g.123077 Transcript_38046/m.123077 type:complete len:1230 (+) Transcript_38046:108-3797(+)
MGCWASVPAKDTKDKKPEQQAQRDAKEAAAAAAVEGALLVRGAKDLRDADWLGKSDPFVLCRMGQAGTEWADKPSDGERRSGTVEDSLSPVWQLAFRYKVPQGMTADGYELHLRVYDQDLITFNDFLGEARVTVAALAEHADEAREYPLTGKEGGAAQGCVLLMVGERVEAALAEEVRADLAAEEAAGAWGALVSPLTGFVSRVGMYFTQNVFGSATYWSNMIAMGLAWNKPCGDDEDPYTKMYLGWTTGADGVESGEWSGPEAHDCITYSHHAKVSEVLASLGGRFGESDGGGEVERQNFLGFQALNGEMWQEQPWKSIALACPQEAHAWIRPLLTKLTGPTGNWSGEYLSGKARAFFDGRRELKVNGDLRVWTTRILHEVMLGLSLTEREGAEFMALQFKIMIRMAAPAAAVEPGGLLRGVLGVEELYAARAALLDKFKPALLKRLPEETAKMTSEQLTQLASSVCDALMFAGGQSIPTVLSFALALPYSAWGERNLPAGFALDNVAQLPRYLLEIIRRFSPVAGFAFTERSFGSTPPRSVFLNLQMAQLDPRVWEAPGKFVLRPMAEYHRKSVAFAEPAVAPLLSSANSHSCPAKELGLQMCLAFLKELARTADGMEESVKDLWLAHEPKPNKKRLHEPLPPQKLKVCTFGPGAFLLKRSEKAKMPPSEKSGAELLDGLSKGEKAELASHVANDNKFWSGTNANTRTFIRVVQLVVKPDMVGPADTISTKFNHKEHLGGYDAPFGGLRFPKVDEDLENTRLYAFLRVALNAAAAAMPLDTDEDLEDLQYFDSNEEAVMATEATFGRYLPLAYKAWDNLATDEGFAELCFCGAGGWYLTAARSEEASGHAVAEGAVFEASLDYMGKYKTRNKWITYGGTAYFGAPPAGQARAGALLGIWSCEMGALLTPGNERWEQAKAGWRSSLGCSLTLKDHLGHLHWVVAHGLMLAAREQVGPSHPLRRLLKQHYFATASINFTSREMLMPVKGFGYRTFGFTDESWVQFFNDLTAEWKWVPFPERIAACNFPDGFADTFPIATDGLKVWRLIAKYVRAFLGVFYEDDSALLADNEVGCFYGSFETQFGTPWRLPPLSLDSLTTLLADLIWNVTAGHELVGSIVEYLTVPDGLPGKLAPGATQPDVQSFAQALVVISLTGVKQPPLIDDYTHLFQCAEWEADKQQAALRVVRDFQADLVECAEELDALNTRRIAEGGAEFVTFNPRLFETSVSI